jgi:hypothetical protein
VDIRSNRFLPQLFALIRQQKTAAAGTPRLTLSDVMVVDNPTERSPFAGRLRGPALSVPSNGATKFYQLTGIDTAIRYE